MEEVSTLLGTLFAAFIGSILGPFIIYKYKKKYDAFITAGRALAHFYIDATKESSQSQFPHRDDLSDNTIGLIIKANDLVMVHFSTKAYKLFDEAIREKVSRQDAPNSEFHTKKETAINAMKRELFLHWVPQLLLELLFVVILVYFVKLLVHYL